MNRAAAFGTLGVAVTGASLELAVRLGLASPEVIPPTTKIVTRAVGLLADPEVQTGLGHTLEAWVLATLLAALAAVALGIAIGLSKILHDACVYLIDLLRPVPSVGLLPAAILLFGLGLQMKVSLAVYAAFWPMLLNTIYGVTDVDRGLRQTALTLHWSPLRIGLFVVLPGAAPYIATGIRLGASVSLIVVLTTEIVAAKNGFGHILTLYQAAGEPTLVYAGILMTGLLGLCVNFGLGGLERRLLRWAPAPVT